MQTAQEIHRKRRGTSLTLQHKPGLLCPSCCRTQLGWRVALGPGRQGSLIEVAVTDSAVGEQGSLRWQWHQWGWCSLKAHEPHSPVDCVRCMSVERKGSFTKGSGSGHSQRRLEEAKETTDALWSLTDFLFEHTGDTPWVLRIRGTWGTLRLFPHYTDQHEIN